MATRFNSGVLKSDSAASLAQQCSQKWFPARQLSTFEKKSGLVELQCRMDSFVAK